MSQKEFLDKNGYLVVKDFFDAGEIAILKSKFKSTVFEENRINQYDQWAGTHPDDILEFLKAPKFRDKLLELTSCRLMWAQMQAFKLESGESAHRLKWHFGRESYLYLMPYFAGWTLWIPLDPIDPAEQRGGMAFLSKELFDGGCEARLLSEMASRDNWQDLAPSFLDISRNFIDNTVLDEMRDEPVFNVGDAVLIHKFTYHTSVVLNEGALARRRAIAFRFVDEDGLLNKFAVERFGPYLANKKMSSLLADRDHNSPLKETDMFKTLY